MCFAKCVFVTANLFRLKSEHHETRHVRHVGTVECLRPNRIFSFDLEFIFLKASFLSDAKRPYTCPPAAGRFLFGTKRSFTCSPDACWFHFGRKALLYTLIDRRQVSFRETGLLSGAKRPCTWPPVIGRFPFGREAPVYMPTGRSCYLLIILYK